MAVVVKMGQDGSRKNKKFKLHSIDESRKLSERKRQTYFDNKRKAKREV